MAESTIQPGTNPTQEPAASTVEHNETTLEETQQAVPSIPTPTIIWTPSFMVIFALTLVLGLSAESLLTQSLAHQPSPGDWVLLALSILVLVCWLFILVRANSQWIRIGAIFIIIWAFFTIFSLIIDLRSVDPGSPIVAHLHAATSSALLGSYICLSLNRTPLHRWDARFFRIALLLGSCVVALAYFLTPAENRSLSLLEGYTVTTALFLCVFVWWLRPSCWKAQPGPTFLFGIAPIILLSLSIPNITDGRTHFFLLQVMFLCIILGAMRMLQCELVN